MGGDIRGNSGTASININGGTWTQILNATKIFSVPVGSPLPIGQLTINGGAMILQTSNSSTGYMFSSIDIINGGSLTLNNFSGSISISSSISVDISSVFNVGLSNFILPPSVTFNGVVNYNQAGPQTIAPATYTYLKFDSTSTKTLGGPITITNYGTLELSGTSGTTLGLGGFALSVFPTGTNLIYSSAANQLATASEWDPIFKNITINNTSATGVSMAGLNRTISGSLNLVNGTFNIGTGGALTLNGAPLNRVNGFLDGKSTSDLSVTGATGGTVLLPLSGNISLRNVYILGTRTLAMDGLNNIDLNGAFSLGLNATYDNGGESQITNGGGSISIDGKFFNRDKDNFTGTNGAVPGIVPTLNSACTIEYGLNGNQVVTARSDYKNITFSGSGIKTPSNAFTPTGTLTITSTAILDASNHNISDGSTVTNFTMDGGRIILGTTTPTTQPQINGLYNLTGGVVEFAGSNCCDPGNQKS